jgi:hypothetical protein
MSKGKSMQQAHHFFIGSCAAMCLAGSLSMTAIAEEGISPDLAQTISKVRENVVTLHNKLPDFICHEEVSVLETENSKTTEKKHYLLSLRAVRRTQDAENQFSESRDVISATVNGKAVNENKYDPPVHFLRGGFARDLFTFFDEPTSSCYEFKLASTPGATLPVPSHISAISLRIAVGGLGWVGRLRDGAANNQEAGALAQGIGGSGDALLVADGGACRTNAGNDQHAFGAGERAQSGNFLRRADKAANSRLQAHPGQHGNLLGG